MGIITLTIIRGNNTDGTLSTIEMKTGGVREQGKLTHKTVYWERKASETVWGDQKAAADINFKLNMTNIRFDKKMYSPNEIVADIQLSVECAPDKIRKAFISKSELDTIFVNKQVKLVCDETSVCDDYYVHEVIPRRYKDEMWVTLKIFSPDKLMTLKTNCSAFVAQKLSNILSTKAESYLLPLKSDCSQMRNLISEVEDDTKTKKIEHIFPYLVQYNESFYDFLARTANRWGEFMYYEDNKLNIGNTAPAATTSTIDSISGYSLLTWHNLADKELADTTMYASEAFPDKNLLGSVIVRDKYDEVKGTLENAGDLEKGADTFWMSKVAQVFGNDKNMSQFALDALIDDTMTIAQAHARVDKNNGRINDKYLKYDDAYEDKTHTKQKPQYEVKNNIVTQFNQFSEINPIVDVTKYGTILKGELEAGKNAIKVEYDTKFPGLKLGSIITFESKQYIVIEVEGYQPEIIKQDNNGNYEHAYKTSEVRYRITAIAAQGTAFYPMMLPSGHIRKSGPQMAVVVDVDDPLRCNRVRVEFPWMLKSYIDSYNKGKADDKKIKNWEELGDDTIKGLGASGATPWLICASPNGPKGAGVHGRHYLAEKVLVDFADGNVERPYVVGAVSRNVPGGVRTGSAVLAAPNGESVKVHEGTGLGVAAFLGSMNPGLKLIRGFVGPFGQDIIWKNNEACLEGGVDISDKYGIWSIKGSTHDRNISIKSPWGDVKIDAFTGITISAPNGDVKIKGKNVSIEAGNNLTLTSGKNIKNQLFPSLGKGAEVWWEELGLQAGAAITTKLFPMVLPDVFDLSLLRKVFEVFFRPDEGLLEIKSNRYLKLEAGKGNADYPDEAYYDKSKLVIAANKARSASSGGLHGKPYFGRYTFWDYNPMVPDVLKLFTQIRTYIDDQSEIIRAEYNCAVALKKIMDEKLGELKELSDENDPGEPILPEDYHKLLTEIWNQDCSKPFKKWCKDKISFQNRAKEDFQGSPIVNGHFVISARARQTLHNNRQKAADNFVVVVNDLRLKVYEILKMVNVKIDENVETLKVEFYGFPQNTIKNLVADALKKIGEFTSDEKDFELTINKDNFRTKARRIAARKLALSLLDELGFDDNTRVFTDVDNRKPEKPATDADISDDNQWNAYVDSIQKVPKFDFQPGNFVKKNMKMLNQQWDKFAFWRSISEWRSWGDNSKGGILYSSDSKTYKLGDAKPLSPGHSSGYLDEDDLSQKYKGYMDEIRDILKGL